ncbi:MAG: hypothetical protein A3J42_08600 [Candidatus Dadabacteria bacterium RIFCSPHIGHO2_12_FULL_53_21]|nr:MAG: hypothetical protein A3J42_08600 [Candidatus Dadabacteria bacterium RIFCSPHIGHO2_12_FULL_53_21]
MDNRLKEKFAEIFDVDDLRSEILVNYYYLNKSMREMYKDYNTYVQEYIDIDEQVPVILSSIFAGGFDDIESNDVADLFVNVFKKISYVKDLKRFSNFKDIKQYVTNYILKKNMTPSEFVKFIGFCLTPAHRLLGGFLGGEMGDGLVTEYNRTLSRWLEIGALKKKPSGDIWINNHAYLSNKFTPLILEVNKMEPNRKILELMSTGYMYRILINQAFYKPFLTQDRVMKFLTKFYNSLDLAYDDYYLNDIVDTILGIMKDNKEFANVIDKRLQERQKEEWAKNIKKYEGKSHLKVFGN